MIRRFLIAALLLCLSAAPAFALNCSSFPFTLQNGQTADASQVMSNFNNLLSCADNNLAHNGANSDITSILGLTTPLAVTEGGTPLFTAGTSTGSSTVYTITPSPTFTLSTGYRVSFIAGYTNTGSAVANVNGTGAGTVFKKTPSGLAALTAGDVVVGQAYTIQWDGSNYQLLDNLGFINPMTVGGDIIYEASSTQPARLAASTIGARLQTNGTSSPPSWTGDVVAPGDMRNAKMSVSATSSSSTFSADYIAVSTALNGTTYGLPSYSQSINLASTGAGGMDTGSAPTSGFVSLYAIYNPTTPATSILACNITTSSGTIYSGANMPAGYTASALIGVWPTSGDTPGKFILGYQYGRKIVFPDRQALTITSSVPTSYTSVSISSLVPSVAKSFSGVLGDPIASNNGFAIAADSSGTAKIGFTAVGPGELVDNFFWSAGFTDEPMITAQTFYYKSVNSGFAVGVEVNGYTF